jgi:hypothetical protein
MPCSLQRGTRSDGWLDDRFPRRFRCWGDALQVLLSLVRSGSALAFLRAFAPATLPAGDARPQRTAGQSEYPRAEIAFPHV